MTGKLGTKRSWTGGKERGERGARPRAVGEGSENSLEERRRYGDMTWRESGEDVGSSGK